ncbi:MAG: 30S ribosomal protein S8e, partial [Candidatus Korarchaeota archaeon]|nr:30S ribosomal protein S8e [Candidatus Korarchaeota archaeon]
GRPPAFTVVGARKLKPIRIMGGGRKLRLVSDHEVNVALGDGTTKKVKILDVMENPASKVLTRRKIITRGALVKTELGLVRITSRPGQHGILNGVLLREEVAS